MSLHTDITVVHNAVGKLNELGTRMKSDEFDFYTKDLSNIDVVIEILYDLERRRKLLHDELETVTITASVSRHKLYFLPALIREEILEAVNAARASNAKAQQELQDKLNRINENIIFLGNRHQELEKDNSILHPERELIRQQHEEIISQLNQKMAEKASMQIALNETRDKVRLANQNIVDLEDGILQLKEDLIQERTEARQEKKRLKKAVADTEEKTKDQLEQNIGKKKELDEYQARLKTSEAALDVIRKSIRQYDMSRNSLEEEEMSLNVKLTKDTRVNCKLTDKGQMLETHLEKEYGDFNDEEKLMQSQIEKFRSNISAEEDKLKHLREDKQSLTSELTREKEKMENDMVKIELFDAELQQAKDALTNKAEEVGKLQAEILEMTEQLEQLAESHKAVLAQLHSNVEELRGNLREERKDRIALQDRRNSMQKNLEDCKAEQNDYIMSVNNKIKEGKTRHVQLTNEGAQLKKELHEDETAIKLMEEELRGLEDRFEDMSSALDDKIRSLEEDIQSMEDLKSSKSKEVDEQTPIFDALEKQFDLRSIAYDQNKKDVIVLKNKKNALEEAIKKMKKAKEAAHPAIAILQGDIMKSRGDALTQLKEFGSALQGVERNIYVEGSKLKTILNENIKFGENCENIEAEIRDLMKQMSMNEMLIEMLQSDHVVGRENLETSWEDDSTLQETLTNRDAKLLDGFQDLLDKTEKREEVVADIAGRLNGELSVLASFLENVSNRRPKELASSSTRKSKRKALKKRRGQFTTPSPHRELTPSSKRAGSSGSSKRHIHWDTLPSDDESTDDSTCS